MGTFAGRPFPTGTLSISVGAACALDFESTSSDWSRDVDVGEALFRAADPALYRDQGERVQALRQRYTAIEGELMQCLARWEELEGRHKASTKIS